MAKPYSVSLEKLIKDNGLEILYVPNDPSEIFISSRDVHCPGLMLAGHDRFFDPKRVQFLGLGEYGYLNSLTDAEKPRASSGFWRQSPAA